MSWKNKIIVYLYLQSTWALHVLLIVPVWAKVQLLGDNSVIKQFFYHLINKLISNQAVTLNLIILHLWITYLVNIL